MPRRWAIQCHRASVRCHQGGNRKSECEIFHLRAFRRRPVRASSRAVAARCPLRSGSGRQSWLVHDAEFREQVPYGLGGSGADKKESLKKSLGRQFVLMLGDRDTDPNHTELRKTPKAMAEGATRLERGQNFFKEAGNAPGSWTAHLGGKSTSCTALHTRTARCRGPPPPRSWDAD